MQNFWLFNICLYLLWLYIQQQGESSKKLVPHFVILFNPKLLSNPWYIIVLKAFEGTASQCLGGDRLGNIKYWNIYAVGNTYCLFRLVQFWTGSTQIQIPATLDMHSPLLSIFIWGKHFIKIQSWFWGLRFTVHWRQPQRVCPERLQRICSYDGKLSVWEKVLSPPQAIGMRPLDIGPWETSGHWES